MRVPKSAVIFEPGEKADGIYIVRSGQVAVHILDAHNISVWSRKLSECGILGLPAAVGHHCHGTRAIASANSELIFVEAQTLANLIECDPKLGAQVLMLISEELADLAPLSPDRHVPWATVPADST